MSRNLIRYKNSPCILFLLIWLCCSLNSFSQEKALYPLHEVPQSSFLNPAVYHECRFFIGLPVLSSLSTAVNSTGWGYHDFIRQEGGDQSDNLAFDFNHLMQTLRKVNYLDFSFQTDILSIAFPLKKYYCTFNIRNHSYLSFSYPGSLAEVALGNWDVELDEPRLVDLSGIAIRGYNYTSFGFSVSRKISEGFFAGVRLKYLKGAAEISSPRNEILLTTTPNPLLDFNLDYGIRLSMPLLIEADEEGNYTGVSAEGAGENLLKNYFLNKNRGLSFDVGIVRKLDKDITFSASMVDLGLMRWKSNTTRLDANGNASYQGEELDTYISGNQVDIFSVFQESFESTLNVSTRGNAYLSFLTPKIFVAGLKQISDYFSAGVTTMTKVYNKTIYPQASVNLLYHPVNFFTFGLNYSMMNKKFNQLGYSLVLGNRGLQFYLVTDHIPLQYVRDVDTGLIWPYNARTLNIHFGLNILFGCSRSIKDTDICPAYRIKTYGK